MPRSASVRTRPLSRTHGSMRAPSNASNMSSALSMARSQSRCTRDKRKKTPTPERDAYRTSAGRASAGSGVVGLAPFTNNELRAKLACNALFRRYNCSSTSSSVLLSYNDLKMATTPIPPPYRQPETRTAHTMYRNASLASTVNRDRDFSHRECHFLLAISPRRRRRQRR